MTEDTTKPWWASRTIWTAAVILILQIASAFGLEANSTEAEITDVATGLLAIAAIAARILATRRIK